MNAPASRIGAEVARLRREIEILETLERDPEMALRVAAVIGPSASVGKQEPDEAPYSPSNDDAAERGRIMEVVLDALVEMTADVFNFKNVKEHLEHADREFVPTEDQIKRTLRQLEKRKALGVELPGRGRRPTLYRSSPSVKREGPVAIPPGQNVASGD